MPTSPSSLPLEHLHPALWRAHQLGGGRASAVPSGYPALDRVLPGGGWPGRALTELLLDGPGWGEMRLLAPALARVGAAGRGLLLIGPPAQPCAEALLQLAIPLSRCVLIRGDDLLWPLEQALRSGHVGAIVAWAPPGLKGEALRRLQLAAQSHDGPAFVVRPPAVAGQPSPAPLRLALAGGVRAGVGPDVLSVHILKRRGPRLERPLLLELPPVLSETARARAILPQPSGASASSTHAHGQDHGHGHDA